MQNRLQLTTKQIANKSQRFAAANDNNPNKYKINRLRNVATNTVIKGAPPIGIDTPRRKITTKKLYSPAKRILLSSDQQTPIESSSSFCDCQPTPTGVSQRNYDATKYKYIAPNPKNLDKVP